MNKININKKYLISGISLFIFILFLAFATKVLLNKPKRQDAQITNINAIDVPLPTVYLIPNNGVIEINVEGISTNTQQEESTPYTTADTTSSNSKIETLSNATDTTEEETAMETNNQYASTTPQPEAPKVSPEEKYQIPETGSTLGINTVKNPLFKVFVFVFLLGVLIRLLIKTVI